MTKYILHGGNYREINIDNDSFFAQTTAGLDGKTKVLLNYFSRNESEVATCFEQDRSLFLKNSQNKNLEFEVAQVREIAAQIQRNQVIYFRGGETRQLIEKMSGVSNLEKIFDSKVVVGSSAGAYMLSTHYWENDDDTLGEGLLDIKF